MGYFLVANGSSCAVKKGGMLTEVNTPGNRQLFLVASSFGAVFLARYLMPRFGCDRLWCDWLKPRA
jgi:hypothetical protein